jgi:c-di-AMP phosphodiesterase-like protein
LGASLGVYEICKALNATVSFVYEDSLVEHQTKRAFRQVFTNDQIMAMTVTPLKAQQIVNDQTLVIVVDTHRPEMTLAPKILEKCKEVCVIDHHRKGDSFINDPVFQYHEAQSSSASELVTELIYYQPMKMEISEQVANFLLHMQITKNINEKPEKPIIANDGKEHLKSSPKKNSNKVKRNEPCPCGSGKKYKQCCGK